MRNVRIITCKICNKEFKSIGIATHFKDAHKLSVDEYVQQTGHEYRTKVLKYTNLTDNNYNCKICNKEFHSNKRLFHHIKEHNILNDDYIKKYILLDDILCKCGCGQEVRLICRAPWKREFITGHNSKGENNGRYNKSVTAETKELMSKRAIERVNNTNKKDTNLELYIKGIFDALGINYIQQYITEFGAIDFYLTDYNILLEIDGVYWHPLKQEHLNFYTISNSINDYKKVKNLPGLIKIHESNINNIKTINDLSIYKYIQDFNIGYHTTIIQKEYFIKYKEYKGEVKLKSKVPLLLKYIRSLHPKFPIIPTSENILSIVNKINEYDLDSIITDNTFNNNCSNVGISYLKSNFQSYWNSRYKSNKYTPLEAWYNDDILKKIIEYRIGCNSSGDIFDFTIHQLIRGLSANRYTISFFKPIVAAAIYKHFLKEKKSPVVLDPCAGFGGRMLGFKSIYPDGTYIGIEPNPTTYKELVELSKNFSNVYLYNCKYEDFDISNLNYDLAFTSIPYYDLEIYSTEISYDNLNSWKSSFLNSIKNTPNIIVNIPQDLRAEFDNVKEEYYLKSNTSHFNKSSNTKIEYILSL
jgi:G:T-mismatch repair DNA endonuclease (very short patch repair protein)